MFSERTCDTPFGVRTEIYADGEIVYARYTQHKQAKPEKYSGSIRVFTSYLLVFGFALIAFFAKRG